MNHRHERNEAIDAVLDGWFGEPLAHAEDEANKTRHLYMPLYGVVQKAFEAGQRAHDDYQERVAKHQRKRTAAANKNAARLFKDACDARERARIAEERLAKVPAHILAMFR